MKLAVLSGSPDSYSTRRLREVGASITYLGTPAPVLRQTWSRCGA